ncbi:MAG: hydroxymethylbilane synthase [Ardenticatenaceae bacterium]|nr:hydroxymethylbilane synthase [Ardenticatenaceae bacterium]
MEKTRLVIGSRKSKLALWQTHYVAGQLERRWPPLTCQIVHFDTQGDQIIDRPLPEIGGKGLFTAELENGLRTGIIDLAVHSLKDLPVEDAPGLTLGAITARADVRDALVSKNNLTLEELPKGTVVGTSSPRRALQLNLMRPDLQVRSIRGNVETRVKKVLEGPYDAAVLAMAGLVRLEMTAVISEIFPLEQILPAPGQGALAVQCRAADDEVLTLLRAIDDAAARNATTAERIFLAELGGGCSAPVGALATVEGDHQLKLRAFVGDPQQKQGFWFTGEGRDPVKLGRSAAIDFLNRGAVQPNCL